MKTEGMTNLCDAVIIIPSEESNENWEECMQKSNKPSLTIEPHLSWEQAEAAIENFIENEGLLKVHSEEVSAECVYKNDIIRQFLLKLMDDGSAELSKILKDIDDVDLLREIILML